MTPPLTADFEVVLAIRFSVPAGTSPEQAAKMLAHGGVNIPVSLIGHVRSVNVDVVPLQPAGLKLS